MKVRTHFHLAKLSLKNLKSLYPEKFSSNMFYLGTILADCSWLAYTNPHFYKRSFKYVEKKLDSILKKEEFNWYNSLQFGIVIHYLCDFCCYSHITDRIGNVNDHMIYERKIQRYLLDNLTNIKTYRNRKNKNKFKDIKIIINNQISKYRNGKPSFRWDIENCLEMSTDVCETVFYIFKRKKECSIII